MSRPSRWAVEKSAKNVLMVEREPKRFHRAELAAARGAAAGGPAVLYVFPCD